MPIIGIPKEVSNNVTDDYVLAIQQKIVIFTLPCAVVAWRLRGDERFE